MIKYEIFILIGDINMADKIKLSQMYFGDEDGATEVCQNENFHELFYDQDDYYNELITGDKFLVIGRKGTGKTILANYLKKTVNSNSNKNEISNILTGNEIKLYKFLSKGDRSINVEEMEIFCEYILLSHIIENILELNKFKKFVPFTKVNKARKMLKNYDFLFKISQRESTDTVEVSETHDTSFKFGTSSKLANSSGNKYIEKEYYEKIKTLRETVKSLIKGYHIYFILDELDDLKVAEKMDKKFSQYTASLINVTKKINNEFSNINNGRVKFIVMLRSDIIKYLNENDSNINKSIANKCIKLNWIKKVDNDWDHPLMKLILLKIKKSVPEYKDLSYKDIYNLVFPFEIKYKSVMTYLLDNSFGRPRDIISYLNIIKRNNKDDFFRPGLFTYNYKEYSKVFYDELTNEICIHEESDMIKDTLNLIRSFRKINFKFEKIEAYYLNNKSEYPNISNLKTALRILYKFGVVGNSWKVGRDKNGKDIFYVSWGHREDSDPNVNFDNTFTVHYALRPVMSLK